jgi:PAS domain S-box-containing protein
MKRSPEPETPRRPPARPAGGWLTIPQKVLILLTIPSLFVLVLLGFVAQTQEKNRAALEAVARSRDAEAEVEIVLRYLIDAETGVRGYVVTGDRAFAEPTTAAREQLPAAFERLRDLARGRPDQEARAAAIEVAATASLDWLRETERAATADIAAAADRIRAGDGKRLTDVVRREVDAFRTAEHAAGREFHDQAEKARADAGGVLLLQAVLGFLGTFGLAVYFWRGIGRRFAALETNARHVAAGGELPPPIGGTDEIARVDQAFRHMAGELTTAAARVRDLYDRAPCGYHSVGPDGIVIAMNQTELGWLGYAAHEVIGRRRFAEFLAPACVGRYQEAFAYLREHGAVSDVELEVVHRSGAVRPVLVSSTAVRDTDGRYVSSRTTLTDLTERKRAEAEVRRLNAELEDRVRARTADLAAANHDLAAKNAENEMFVYSVSHDLRSPLVNLQGFSRELGKACDALRALMADDRTPAAVRDPATALLTGKMSKALGFIESAVLRLSSIIDALLRLSRAGREEYRWQAVDVGQAVNRVIDSLQTTINETGAVVRVGPLPKAWGDPTALEQVFANLIGNALAYLAPERPGVIEVGGEAKPDGAHYYVRDNGRGIKPEHHQKVFRVFQRVHPGVGSGEGMGLAIVARVVERHRGKVWVESEEGAGSTFHVVLPGAA